MGYTANLGFAAISRLFMRLEGLRQTNNVFRQLYITELIWPLKTNSNGHSADTEPDAEDPTLKLKYTASRPLTTKAKGSTDREAKCNPCSSSYRQGVVFEPRDDESVVGVRFANLVLGEIGGQCPYGRIRPTVFGKRRGSRRIAAKESGSQQEKA